MFVHAIQFTRETLPTIYAQYPNLNGRWDASMLFSDGDEYLFVHDTALQQRDRVITKDHFQEVYEIPASEIGTTFKRIY